MSAEREGPVVAPSVGIDLLEIERLERALARRPRLAERLFTAGERAYANGRARPGQHLAARFCAKEAVAKALGLTAWSFLDIEVISGDGAPAVALHGAVAERAGQLGVEVSLSLTHTSRDASAIALLFARAIRGAGSGVQRIDSASGGR